MRPDRDDGLVLRKRFHRIFPDAKVVPRLKDGLARLHPGDRVTIWLIDSRDHDRAVIDRILQQDRRIKLTVISDLDWIFHPDLLTLRSDEPKGTACELLNRLERYNFSDLTWNELVGLLRELERFDLRVNGTVQRRDELVAW